MKAERERLDAKEREIMEKYERKTGWLSTQLLSYMTTVKTRDTATQSIYKLLNATLVYKKAHTDISAAEGLQRGWKQTDRELSKSQRHLTGQVSRKSIIQIGEGVYAMKDTGEIVEGVVAAETPGKFEVK